MPQIHTNGDLSFKSLFVFFLLYFVQGIPFGLQTRFLPLFFRVRGMTLANVDLFKLLMLPWILKAFWAPFVDNYFTKKSWLNMCLIMMCLLCTIASFITPSDLYFLAIVMFLFNLTTSVQDIALDSLVIETLPTSQLAKGNIAQVVGYKTGGLFSGGVFSLFTNVISWHSIFLILAIIYILGLLVSVLFLPKENVTVSDSDAFNGSSPIVQASDVSRLEDTDSVPNVAASVMENTLHCYFWKIFRTHGTVWLLFFVFFYKVGEQGVLNMYPMFLLDNGISANIAGFWTGFTGQAFSVLGSFLGGVMNSRHLFSDLKTLILVRSCSVLLIWLGILMWNSFYTLSYVCSVFALQIVFLTGGAITTITYTLIMQLSQKAPYQCRATHYTILTTGDVLGRLLFSSTIGGITQLIGYPLVFALFTIISFLVQIHLSFAPPTLGNY